MKTKQLEKGIMQLTDEGVAQLFIQQPGNRKIVGVVGELQFEVIQHRLQHEYSAACDFQYLPYTKACWITSDNEEKMKEFISYKYQQIAYDKEGNTVFLADSEWNLKMTMEKFPDIKYHFTSEFKADTLVV
jgi:peptide chain release factor 3